MRGKVEGEETKRDTNPKQDRKAPRTKRTIDEKTGNSDGNQPGQADNDATIAGIPAAHLMRNIFLLPGQKGSYCHSAADCKGNRDKGNIAYNTVRTPSICQQGNQK